MADLGFDGRVAIVTGAGGGLGREHAKLLAARGALVVVNDLGGAVDGSGGSATPAQQVVEEIKASGGEAVADAHSVGTPEDGEAIVQTALDTFGRVDIVVNNAGILRDKAFHNLEPDMLEAVLTVHLKGAFYVTRHAWKLMREQNYGRVVNTSSSAGILGNFGQSNYGSAKAALALMAIVIDREMSKYGVTANAIAPLARTRLTVDATPSTAAFMGREVKEGEFDVFSPRNVAPLIAWLGSDDAKDVHGEVFRVGGGTVWLMSGWHTVGKVSQRAAWEPAILGEKLKVELGKGITAKEDMSQILAGALGH